MNKKDRMMMNRRMLAVAGMVSLMAMGAVQAQTAQPICADPNTTIVTLNAEARRMVPQDKLQATLNIEASANTAAEAQAQVNRKMQAAKKIYDDVRGLKVSTGGYNVYKVYPNEGPRPLSEAERERQATWRASQQLVLDGSDRDAMIKLVNTLQQQGFAVQNLNYYLSKEGMDALRDQLTAEALTTIRSRADKMGNQLGLKVTGYSRIDASSSMGGNPPTMLYARAAAMKSEMADAPVVQAGESEVVVNVNADVKMR